MVKPNFTIGTVFEDGGLYYEVQAVLPSGDYISKRVDKVPEPEKRDHHSYFGKHRRQACEENKNDHTYKKYWR